MRLNDDVGPPGSERHEARRLVVVVLQLQRLQTRCDVLVAPFEEDALLVGAGADDDPKTRRILRFLDRGYAAIGFDEEAVQPLPIG
ncbi:hypothetical protein D9M70_648600 [compost metagenome]